MCQTDLLSEEIEEIYAHRNPEAEQRSLSSRRSPPDKPVVSHMKSLKRLVKRRILEHLAKFEVMIPEQFGFHSGHSTMNQLKRAMKYVAESGCEGLKTAAIFLDIEQTFYRVWDEGVLYKLNEVQLPDCYVRLIVSFLEEDLLRENRRLCLFRGVSLRCSSGQRFCPILYSVLVDDALRQHRVQLSLFADATVSDTARHTANFVIARPQRQFGSKY